jgi:isoleucyl-tRNA synthetase
LQLIGLAWLGWFVLGNLLYADDREKLSQTLQSWIQEILGRFSDDESKPVAKSQEEDAIEPIVTIPSPPSPFSILEKTAKIKPVSSTVNKSPLVGNGIDELRYLFITSGVELLESPEVVDELPYSFKSEGLAVGVTKAEGQKCDRCWNYSTHVGESQEDPLICERCVAALDEVF